MRRAEMVSVQRVHDGRLYALRGHWVSTRSMRRGHRECVGDGARRTQNAQCAGAIDVIRASLRSQIPAPSLSATRTTTTTTTITPTFNHFASFPSVSRIGGYLKSYSGAVDSRRRCCACGS